MKRNILAKPLAIALSATTFLSMVPATALTTYAASTPAVKSIKKVSTASKYTVTVGKTTTLKAKVTFKKSVNKKAATKAIKVTSSSKNATVSATLSASAKKSKTWTVSVKVKAAKAGAATVKVAAGKKSVSWKVTGKAATVAATDLSLDRSAATLAVGSTLKLNAVVTPSNSTDKVTFTSSNTAVATVTTDGTVTGVAAGTAEITAQAGNITKICTVTVSEGEKNDDDVDVIEDVITIADITGLQTDGTALKGDVLSCTMPTSIGTVDQLLWYCNGSILQTTSTGGQGANWTTAKAGEYYAIAITTKGTTYKSNTITVTTKEQPAVIKAFTIEDDYTSGAAIDYDTTDNHAVATVTLNKGYDGNFRIYKKSDSKYTTNIGAVVDSTIATTASATAFGKLDNAPTNSLVLADTKRYAYQNEDGSVMYKFIATGLTRGVEYVITFDQDSVESDNPTSGVANVFETAVAAPYVTAPSSIAITSVAASAKPKIAFNDENGNVLSWMQGTATSASTTNTAANTGFADVKIFSAKTNVTSGGTNLGATTAGYIIKGVYESNIATSATPDAFWYATVTTKKGIFGANAITLTSAAKDIAQQAAGNINVAQSSKAATSADVTFENLRCAGTVYIVNSTAANGTPNVNPNDTTTYTASASVEKGAAVVTVENAIHSTTSAGGNYYDAVFIPENQADYSSVSTSTVTYNTNKTVLSTASKQGVQITQDETYYSIEVSGDAANSVTANGTIHVYKVQAFDQFAEKMTTSAPASAYKTTPGQASDANSPTITVNWIADTSPATTATMQIASDKHGSAKIGDTWSVKIGETTFVLTCENLTTDPTNIGFSIKTQ